MLLKVCGLRESDNVEDVMALQPAWMGFIFEPSSPRYFLHAKQRALLFETDSAVKKVGVFVDEDVDVMIEFQQLYALNYIQLHGNESVDVCIALKERGIKTIKAFSVNEAFDFDRVQDYAPYVTLFLFDASGPLAGGNGVLFNWELLQNHRFGKPFLLSGGIGPDSVAALQNFKHPDMIGLDVNSKFELSPGVKDVHALLLFQQKIAFI